MALINCDVAPSASVKKSQGMMGGLGLPGQQSNKEWLNLIRPDIMNMSN